MEVELFSVFFTVNEEINLSGTLPKRLELYIKSSIKKSPISPCEMYPTDDVITPNKSIQQGLFGIIPYSKICVA